MAEVVRIPRERVAVLIGKDGKAKKEIEAITQTRIKVGADGDVELERKKGALDPLAEWVARDIVKAIGRGFSPERALSLCEEGACLSVIDLSELCGKSRDNLERIKSRIIGSGGKSRNTLESMTGTEISIYGKTVSIIGRSEDVAAAHEAIMRLAEGQMHTTVYKYIARLRR